MRRRIISAARAVVPAASVVVSLVAMDSTLLRVVGLVLAAASLIWLWADTVTAARGGSFATFWIAPLWHTLAAAAVAAQVHAWGAGPVAVVAAFVGLGVVAALAWTIHRLGPVAAPVVRNLEGAPDPDASPPARPLGRWTSAALTVPTVVLALVALDASVIAAVAALVAAAVLAVFSLPYLRFALFQHRVVAALAGYEPVLAMPYAGTANFHLGMWLPYVVRTGLPYILVSTHPGAFERLHTNPIVTVPCVLVDPESEYHVRTALPRTVKASLYVHNSVLNTAFFAIRRVTHVFLHHGDGDKPASSHPRSANYDILVVAGQAAIDRYAARGVEIPRHKFVICGRPQTADIEHVTRPIGEVAAPVVAYAPTWRGAVEAQNLSSLHIGEAVVDALLARGATVIFRPHPAGQKHPPHAKAIKNIRETLEKDAAATGRQHRWGPAAEKITLVEVINAADAMVTDVSGVVTDWMQSGKPLAMTATKVQPDPERGLGVTEVFREDFPSARSAYVIENDLSTLDEALDGLLRDDPLAELRAERRRYYLGGFEGDESAQAFIGLMHRLARDEDPQPPT